MLRRALRPLSRGLCTGAAESGRRAATLAVHAGEGIDASTNASAPPISVSTTFAVATPLSFSANELKETDPWCYTRWANPTVRSLEHKIAALEGLAPGHCVAFASGMAASTALLFSLLQAGDHIVVSDTQYPGVAEVCRYTLPRFGIDATFVDASDTAQIAGALIPGRTKLVWVETPCNPILRLTDLSAASELAHAAGAELVVDSTFATPLLTRPIADHAADWVVHSLSKYIGGHGDAIGGAVCARSAERASLVRTEGAIHHGGVLSPMNAWLISRGAATLPLRMHAHSEGAAKVAAWLEDECPGVERVLYPQLPSHPQHRLARSQMAMGGGMVSFRVRGGLRGAEACAARMMHELRVVHYAVSLGHTRSLVYLLATEDLAERPGSPFALSGAALDAYRELAGDGVFRLSVGIEDPDDIIDDLRRVLT